MVVRWLNSQVKRIDLGVDVKGLDNIMYNFEEQYAEHNLWSPYEDFLRLIPVLLSFVSTQQIAQFGETCRDLFAQLNESAPEVRPQHLPSPSYDNFEEMITLLCYCLQLRDIDFRN